MNLSIMRLAPTDGDDVTMVDSLPNALREHRLTACVKRAVIDARGWLERQQRPDGRWQSDVEGDPTNLAQYLFLLALDDQAESSGAKAVAGEILKRQLATGGWSRYPSGPLDPSASVQAYLALKLTGQETHAEPMQRAREALVSASCIEHIDARTRSFLSLFEGLPDCRGIRELHCGAAPCRTSRPALRVALSQGMARMAERFNRFTANASKRAARTETSLLAQLECNPHPDASTTVAGLISLKTLGHAANSPAVCAYRERLEELLDADEDATRLQARTMPLADTALALLALQEAGLPPDDEPIVEAAEWLREQDLAGPRSCVLETTLAALALWQRAHRDSVASPAGLQLFGDDHEAAPVSPEHAVQLATLAARVERWILARQHRNGGWTSSDGHCATGRVLELLGAFGRRIGNPSVDRAIAFLRATQEPDGSWRGVSHIAGVWQALCGLAAVGVPADDPLMASGANWLLSWQQASGGWGESPASRQDPRQRGQGPVTASQTAWALLGLIAAGQADHPAVARGIRFLVSEQSEEGTWHEPEFTGADGSRIDLYRSYFPLLALSRWLAQQP